MYSEKLFVTKNPKDSGSFDMSETGAFVKLLNRETGFLVGYVWTTQNLSFNRYGGTNIWECSYIAHNQDITVVDVDDTSSVTRLWNKDKPKQILVSPKRCGVRVEKALLDWHHKYVDVYAEVMEPWDFINLLMISDDDLFYQKWGHDTYEEHTFMRKLQGTHLPTQEKVITYSRRNGHVIMAMWDEGDHVMEYYYRNFNDMSPFSKLSSPHFGIYTTFKKQEDLWEAFQKYTEDKEKDATAEEAPACEYEEEDEPLIPHVRPRRRCRSKEEA